VAHLKAQHRPFILQQLTFEDTAQALHPAATDIWRHSTGPSSCSNWHLKAQHRPFILQQLTFEGTAQALHPAATDRYAIISMYISYSPVEIRTGSPSYRVTSTHTLFINKEEQWCVPWNEGCVVYKQSCNDKDPFVCATELMLYLYHNCDKYCKRTMC
jgi:hypothetical protein